MNKLLEIFPQSAGLSARSLVLRLAAIGAIMLAIVVLFAYAGGWLSPRKLTPAAITNRFEQLNGIHPGFRRNHAKGLCISGQFTSSGAGAALSKASVFQLGTVPVIGRFSFGGGLPYAADSDMAVRGLGLRFKTADGQEWRSAMINFPVFPVSTPRAFYAQLLAFAPDPATGKPDPARVKAFLAGYPESAKAFQVIRSHPNSSGFANSTFNSLDAFRFTNTAGETVWARWSFVPVQPFAPINPADSAPPDKNRLFDALIAAVHAHPLQWHLIITIAAQADPLNDATLPWPADRRTVDAGILTIDRVESDDTSSARDLNFDPLILPEGIAPSDDPLLGARSAVYSKSFTRREGEPKEPAAVSATEAGD